MVTFNIADVPVGDDFEPIVIAEIGINHGGSLEVAIGMAGAAIDAGITFVKHQTHIPDAEMSEEAKRVKPGNANVSIYDVVSRCTLGEDEEFQLMDYVRERGGVFFSTPFSREAVDRLSRWNMPAFKIGSGECNNYPLVEYIARLGKPVILSTGMNTVESIGKSVEIFRKASIPYALLHTTNLYPTPNRLLRLGALAQLRSAFPDAVFGLSDHSQSNSACTAAVALGARILERHFTDSSERVGPDIVCSMDPAGARELVIAAREVFEALGGSKGPVEEEQVTMNFAFSSVVALVDLRPGDVLGPENIWVKRPAGGDFGPGELSTLYGRIVQELVPRNHQLRERFLISESAQNS